MLPIQTILHPTDFSPYSEAAYLLAGALARDYGARLVVLHVHPPEFVAGEPYLPPPDPEATRRALHEQLTRLGPDDAAVRAEHRLAEGDPAREILHAAEELKADLIVLGTHGRSGLGRVLMGSVAEGVLRQATCPVLVIKNPFAGGPARPKPEARKAAMT